MVLGGPLGGLAGLSVVVGHGDRVFHTYSTYQRGLDIFLNTYNFLDVTPLGRQEEDGRIQGWIKHHDRYDAYRDATTESNMAMQTLLDTYYAGLARRTGWEQTIADDFVFTGANQGNRLSGDGRRIASVAILLMNEPRLAEPTLGVTVDRDYYFVASSQGGIMRRAKGSLTDETLAQPTISVTAV